MNLPVVSVLVLPLHPDRGERHQSGLTPPPFRHTVINSNPENLCFPSLIFQAVTATHGLPHHAHSYTVKKVLDFPVPSRDSLTELGRE